MPTDPAAPRCRSSAVFKDRAENAPTESRRTCPRHSSISARCSAAGGAEDPGKRPSALEARRCVLVGVAAVTVVRSRAAAPGSGSLRRYKSTQAHASLYAPSVSQSPAGSEDSRCSYQDPTTCRPKRNAARRTRAARRTSPPIKISAPVRTSAHAALCSAFAIVTATTSPSATPMIHRVMLLGSPAWTSGRRSRTGCPGILLGVDERQQWLGLTRRGPVRRATDR